MIDNLRQCHRLVEEFLEKAMSDFKERLESQAAKLPAELRDDFLEFRSPEHWQLSEVFPEMLRSSLFNTAYSHLEVALNDICLLVKRDYAVSVDDMKGKGIWRAKLYLQKVAQVPFPDQSQSWSGILVLNKFRNTFTHAYGVVPLDTSGDFARNFVKAHPDMLQIDRVNRVVLSGKFVPYALDTIAAFLDELYAALGHP
jgi:hypothetical protein